MHIDSLQDLGFNRNVKQSVPNFVSKASENLACKLQTQMYKSQIILVVAFGLQNDEYYITTHIYIFWGVHGS